MNWRILLILLLITLLPVIAEAESYICVDDSTTGFHFDRTKKVWHQASFREKNKHVVTPSREEGKWIVKEVGGAVAGLVRCDAAFDENGDFICDSTYSRFAMNKHSLRFLDVHNIGYWNDGIPGITKQDDQEGENTPYISIGRCDLLDR